MNRIKLTAIQLEIIELLLKQDVLHTSSFVKTLFENNTYTKPYLWSNINELEEIGLIERVCDYKGHQKHKRLFSKEELSDNYGIVFIGSSTTKINNISAKEREK